MFMDDIFSIFDWVEHVVAIYETMIIGFIIAFWYTFTFLDPKYKPENLRIEFELYL